MNTIRIGTLQILFLIFSNIPTPLKAGNWPNVDLKCPTKDALGVKAAFSPYNRKYLWVWRCWASENRDRLVLYSQTSSLQGKLDNEPNLVVEPSINLPSFEVAYSSKNKNYLLVHGHDFGSRAIVIDARGMVNGPAVLINRVHQQEFNELFYNEVTNDYLVFAGMQGYRLSDSGIPIQAPFVVDLPGHPRFSSASLNLDSGQFLLLMHRNLSENLEDGRELIGQWIKPTGSLVGDAFQIAIVPPVDRYPTTAIYDPKTKGMLVYYPKKVLVSNFALSELRGIVVSPKGLQPSFVVEEKLGPAFPKESSYSPVNRVKVLANDKNGFLFISLVSGISRSDLFGQCLNSNGEPVGPKRLLFTPFGTTHHIEDFDILPGEKPGEFKLLAGIHYDFAPSIVGPLGTVETFENPCKLIEKED